MINILTSKTKAENQIVLGGKTYTLPTLPLIKAHLLNRTRTDNPMGEDETKALVEMLYFSLIKSYPDITLEYLESELDLLNTPSIVEVFKNVNLLKSGGDSTGEALAVA